MYGTVDMPLYCNDITGFNVSITWCEFNCGFDSTSRGGIQNIN